MSTSWTTYVPMKTTTRQDLDKVGCGNSDCDHKDDDILHLHSSCHPYDSLEVFYEKQTGKITIACAVCDQAVAIMEIK